MAWYPSSIKIHAECLLLPRIDQSQKFESWRDSASSGEHYARIVVALWCDELESGELLSIDDIAWRTRFELPYLLWNFALGAAAQHCADGGSIVALVQAPAALDASAWVPEFAIACGELDWSVWIAARRAEEGKRVAAEVTTAGGQGHFLRCDIGEPIAVERAINRVIESDGRIDGIVHNATSDLSPVPADLHQASLADIQSHIAVALAGLHALARYGHPAVLAVCC
jgi:hypothetical protein